MTNLFIKEPVVEPETMRTCGSCHDTLDPSFFYRDGLYSDGTVRYRRDCKACYAETRRKATEAKRKKPKRKRRK